MVLLMIFIPELKKMILTYCAIVSFLTGPGEKDPDA